MKPLRWIGSVRWKRNSERNSRLEACKTPEDVITFTQMAPKLTAGESCLPTFILMPSSIDQVHNPIVRSWLNSSSKPVASPVQAPVVIDLTQDDDEPKKDLFDDGLPWDDEEACREVDAHIARYRLQQREAKNLECTVKW